jgi:hypothetical protein
MSSARPPGDPDQPPGPAAAADDPAVAAAVRIQRRRHAWGLATFWFIGLLLLCVGVNSSAGSNGTPSPRWFIGLTIASGLAALAAAALALGYGAALGRRPAEVRAQAILLEKQRIRVLWRYGWTGRLYHVFYWSALWLGMALFLGCAVLGVPWAINGATYLAGAGGGPSVRWSGDIPIHGDGDAAGSLVIGLLFVFGGAMVVFYVYRRATRVWWPRYVQRRARAFGG